MKRIYNILLTASLALMVFACAKPEDPDTSSLIYGDWIVNRLFVNGEYEPNPTPNMLNSIALSLDFDDTYRFVDRAGRISVGTWEIQGGESSSDLVLTDEDGSISTFNIVSIKSNELHMVRNVATSAGDLNLRYIMRRGSQLY